MDNADAGQVLVSQSVYETLRHREKYLDRFRPVIARGKHGIKFQAFQFHSPNKLGLNNKVLPGASDEAKGTPKFTHIAAYYVGHALLHQKFLESRKADPGRDYTAIVLLTLLAEDSVEAANTPSHEEADSNVWTEGSSTFEEQYKHYYEMEFWPRCMLADCLAQKNLQSYDEYFEDKAGGYRKCYCVIRPSALHKLRAEWPEVVDLLAIGKPANKAMEQTAAKRKKRKSIRR